MDEKPLILFKQLEKSGRKPMFMLRKTTAHPDVQRGGSRELGPADGGGGAGAGGGYAQGRYVGGSRGNQGYEPPGGII